MTKIIRTSTVAISLDYLLQGQLGFLQKYYEVVAVSGNDEHLIKVNEREGVRIENVPMQRSIKPFHDIISLYKLYVLFKKEKPLIVHSITPKAGLLSMAAAYLARVPIRIHTFTGLIFPSRRGIIKKVLLIMDKLLCKMATEVYPEGEGVKRDLISHKVTSKPLRVIANGNVNGIDINYFNSSEILDVDKKQLRKELNIEQDELVLIFVGRLVRDKGINELVGAFQKLLLEGLKVKLLLVGPFEHKLDPLSSDTLLTIERNENIICTGFQSDVRTYFAISNALVFPSYREGFPNVVLQAGAMGLPSIVTNINGCNEIIVDGVNGMLIPPFDADAIYKAVKAIIQNDDVRNRLAGNARNMICSRFQQQSVWSALLEEYKRQENLLWNLST